MLLDYYVVLSGCLEVGGFHRIGSGPSKGRWSWGATICTDDTTYTAGGYAAYSDVCCTLIGRHAVIGLSRPRRNKTLEGLALDERLAAKDVVPRCASTWSISTSTRSTSSTMWRCCRASGRRRRWASSEDLQREISIEG